MRTIASICSIALFVAGLCAQTIELRNGEVAIGRVVAVNASSVDVEVGFPEATTRTIQKSDLTPVSLFAILAAQVEPGSGVARVKLAEAARGIGLRGHAIAEYREAARLDPELKAKAAAKVMEIRTEIARALMQDAKQAIDETRFGAARLALSAIDASYGDTPVGREAASMQQQLKEKQLENVLLHKVSTSQLEGILKQVAGLIQKAEEVKGAESPHGSMKAQSALQAVVKHLEKATRAMKDVAPPDSSPELADKLTTARESVRHRLVDGYLALGTVYLQRRAIPNAEKYCEKACDLDYYEGCWAAGDLYHAGSGTTKNDVKAKKYLTKACEGNKHEKACAMLARL